MFFFRFIRKKSLRLKNFQIERDDFDEEVRRLAYLNDQLLAETSIEGSEHLKLKFKQFQSKCRTFNNDVHSFEVRHFSFYSQFLLFRFSGEISSTR